MRQRFILLSGISLFALTLAFAGCGKKEEPPPPPPPPAPAPAPAAPAPADPAAPPAGETKPGETPGAMPDKPMEKKEEGTKTK
jgi:hypothetical protein